MCVCVYVWVCVHLCTYVECVEEVDECCQVMFAITKDTCC